MDTQTGGLAALSQSPLAHEASPTEPGGFRLQAVPVSIRQRELQPSPFTALASSQPSAPSRTPLPHVSDIGRLWH